jgi:hypothetical protein
MMPAAPRNKLTKVSLQTSQFDARLCKRHLSTGQRVANYCSCTVTMLDYLLGSCQHFDGIKQLKNQRTYTSIHGLTISCKQINEP